MSCVRLHVLAGLSASLYVHLYVYFMTLYIKRCFRNEFPLNFLRHGGQVDRSLNVLVTLLPPGCSCFLLHVGISLSVFCFSTDHSSCSGGCTVPLQLSQSGSGDPALTVSQAAPLDGM